ncbi:hypothetical protein BU17DRAFT_84559 [Hysterangium stoloniferum]|nr:hypothetical protein BU17DRAFT_84559 [Hysterangium stoloniferum]
MPAIHSSPHPRFDRAIDPANDPDIDWNPRDEMAGNPYPDIPPGYDLEAWGPPVQAVGNEWSGGYDVPDRPHREQERERVHRHRGRRRERERSRERSPEEEEHEGMPELIPQEQPHYAAPYAPYPFHPHSAPHLVGHPPLWPPMHPFQPVVPPQHSFGPSTGPLPLSQHASRFNPGGNFDDRDDRDDRGDRPYVPRGNPEDLWARERAYHDEGHRRHRDSFEEDEIDDYGNIIGRGRDHGHTSHGRYIHPDDIEEMSNSSGRERHHREEEWIDDEDEEEHGEVRFAMDPVDITEEEHRRKRHGNKRKDGRRATFADLPHLEQAPQHMRTEGGGGGMTSTAIPQWNGHPATRSYKIKKGKRDEANVSRPSFTLSYAPDTYGYGRHDYRSRSAGGEIEAGGLLKAMRWITGYPGSPSLHPLLKTRTLIKPVCMKWDIRVPPEPSFTDLAVGEAVAGFSEAATHPRVSHMTLFLPIPGIERAQWTFDVAPLPYGGLLSLSNSQYTFDGTPTTFSRKFPRSKSENLFEGRRTPYQYDAVVRCVDVFDAICTLLHQNATRADFQALQPSRRRLVSSAFYKRCSEFVGENGIIMEYKVGSGSEEMDERVREQVSRGLKRIDFMVGKTKWEGLRPCGPNGWVVMLGDKM